MDEMFGGRARVEAPGVDVDHRRRATAASAETVIGIYGAARTSPRPVAASEADEEAFQIALEILRARWRRDRDARRSLFPQDEIAAGVRETAPPPPPALEDPVVRRALDSLRAHAERQMDRAQDLPAAPPPSLEDLELEVPFASGVAELELQAEIEITDSIPLVSPRAPPDAPAPKERHDSWGWTAPRDRPRDGEPEREVEPGAAESFCDRLARRAAEFRARVGPDREVGVRLSPVFGEPLYVEDITHDGADMIILRGSTKLGVQVEVMQHLTQANVWFVAMAPRR